MTLIEKFEKLKDDLKALESVAVAFSGGVDSTLLLKVAHDVLGDKAVAITIFSSLFPHRDYLEGSKFCSDNKITQIMCPVDSLKISGIKENSRNRCYLCKKDLFTRLLNIAKERNITNVIDGSNLNDGKEYRPGSRALKELGIKSPLRMAGLSKSDVIELSKVLGLPTWDVSSFACLASRFVYGEPITKEKLKMVENSEQLLSDMGFQRYMVYIHDKFARLEIMPEDFTMMLQAEARMKIYKALKEFGFSYVTLDLKDYNVDLEVEGEDE